jgi:hypothetical protein
MSSSYRDGSLSSSYVGVFNTSSDEVSWTGSGGFTDSDGSLNWVSTGTYSDASQDGFWSEFWHYTKITAVGAVTVAGDVVIVGGQFYETVGSGGAGGPAGAAVSNILLQRLNQSGLEIIVNMDKDEAGVVHTTVKPLGFMPPLVRSFRDHSTRLY